MDRTSLQQLAEGGLDAVPVDRWGDLTAWCWDWAEASGDARYCSIARALGSVDTWMSEHGVTPWNLWQEIDVACRVDLPEILATEEAQDAANLARGFRQRVVGLLLKPERWAGDARPE